MKNISGSYKFYLLLLFTALQLSGYCQFTKIVCTYDAAGNRIQRKPVDTSSPDDGGGGDANRKANKEEKTSIEEEFFQVNVSPNPTRAEINISVNMAEEGSIISMYVSDLMGKKVRTITPAKSTETINLTGLANGIYVVEVLVGEKKRSWNILKQE